MREIPQLKKKPGTALVLSGGATKAFYFHLGVLKALRQETFTSIVGSSAGALVGAFLASGATVDAMISTLYQREVYFAKLDTWVRTLTSNMLFKPKVTAIVSQIFNTWLSGVHFLTRLPQMVGKDILAEAIDCLFESQVHMDGVFDASALENLVKSILRSTDFAHTETDLYVIGTSLDENRRAIFNGLYDFTDDQNEFMTDVPIHRAVRASSAIPGLFEPVRIKGKYYVDGEIKQTLSADIGVRLADRVVISHTYQPLMLRNQESVRDKGWINVFRQSLSIVFYERINIWRKIYERENPGKEILWIQPDPEDEEFFHAPEFTFRPEVQRKLIDAGEIAALKVISEKKNSDSRMGGIVRYSDYGDALNRKN